MSKSKIVFLLLSIVTISGCSQRVADFTIISSKNIDLSKGADFKRGPTRVHGEDLKHIIIIPAGHPNAKEAMDNAIESVPGAVALLDGVLNHNFWYIPYIYGQESYDVEGTPLIDPLLLKNYSK
jgi:hypothetical protein